MRCGRSVTKKGISLCSVFGQSPSFVSVRPKVSFHVGDEGKKKSFRKGMDCTFFRTGIEQEKKKSEASM